MTKIVLIIGITLFILIIIFLINKWMKLPKSNYDERLIFYLGEDLYNTNHIKLDDYPNIIDVNNFKNYEHKHIKPNFDKPFEKLLEKTGYKERKFSYQPGDVWSGGDDLIDVMPSMITFVKNRDRYENKGVILKCFNFKRHWGLYYNKPRDISFENKNDKVIWRGVTTGLLSNPGNRFDLVKKWYNVDPDIDVGFNNIVQSKNDYKMYMKTGLSPEKMLRNKYIISVEGNDKDSGLNWKLNSNSLVLMPKPLSTTWLMERKLVPNHHYILLKDDFSDLKEKLDWCRENQDKCKDIINNANIFMSQFSDNEKENKLEEDIIKLYFQKVK